MLRLNPFVACVCCFAALHFSLPCLCLFANPISLAPVFLQPCVHQLLSAPSISLFAVCLCQPRCCNQPFFAGVAPPSASHPLLRVSQIYMLSTTAVFSVVFVYVPNFCVVARQLCAVAHVCCSSRCGQPGRRCCMRQDGCVAFCVLFSWHNSTLVFMLTLCAPFAHHHQQQQVAISSADFGPRAWSPRPAPNAVLHVSTIMLVEQHFFIRP